jgi:isocitrate/isopropylmalate dehydrogenase
MLVDNAAMQLAPKPERFEIVVAESMFGDIPL